MFISLNAIARDQIQAGLSAYGFAGEYGLETQTFTSSSQAFIRYRHEQWQFRFSQPYIYQDGPAELVLVEDGDTGEDTIVGSEEREQRWGPADPSLSISYSWPYFKKRSAFRKKGSDGIWRAGLRWKLPVADEDLGMSNGRHELVSTLSRSHRIGRFMLHGLVGGHYRQYEEGADNRIRYQFSAGGMYFLNRSSSLGVSLYHKTPGRSQAAPVQTLSAAFRYRFSRHWQIGTQLGYGLTESAAEYSGGLDISYRWWLD